MFKCHVCGSTESRNKFVNEIFWINGKPVLVEKIPAKVCLRCGEAIFSRHTTEKIRKMVHEKSKTVKSIPVDVFEYEFEEVQSFLMKNKIRLFDIVALTANLPEDNLLDGNSGENFGKQHRL